LTRIGVGVLVWVPYEKQLPELERCLDSLTDFYPVIVVNGKWDDIEGKYARSIPEAYDLIGSYSNTIHIESPNEPEFVNRNKYLIQATKMDCDFLFWVDSDEWVELPCGYDFLVNGIKDVYKREPDKYTNLVHFFDPRSGGVCFQKRGVRYPSFSRHKNKHNELWFTGNQVLQYPAKAPRGLIIHHDKSYRSLEREKTMQKRNHDNPVH